MGFTGRVCAITGGGSGIGFAIAERLGAAGATVILFDVNKSALDGAKDKLSAKGVDASAMVVDVTDPSAVEAAFAKIEKRYKRLDALIQAAGITGKTGIKTHEVDPQNFDLVYKINVKGIFLCCKYALPLMVKQKYGRIVNIASVAGKEGNAGMLAYSTSKAAVIGLTKVIGKEFADGFGDITCNALAPAVVRTPMVDAMPPTQVKYMTDKIPMKRCGDLEEIADIVQFMASEACSFTTGFTFDATGGRATY